MSRLRLMLVILLLVIGLPLAAIGDGVYGPSAKRNKYLGAGGSSLLNEDITYILNENVTHILLEKAP
jgi:hypothetical protein